MWSDTVAFMKFSSRPLHIVVARELSTKKLISVKEEFAKAGVKTPRSCQPDPPRYGLDPSSRAKGNESVSKAMADLDEVQIELSKDAEITSDGRFFFPFDQVQRKIMATLVGKRKYLLKPCWVYHLMMKVMLNHLLQVRIKFSCSNS